MNIDEMPAGRELDALVAERVMGESFPKNCLYYCENKWMLDSGQGDMAEEIASADTVQLAICRAALKAVME